MMLSFKFTKIIQIKTFGSFRFLYCDSNLPVIFTFYSADFPGSLHTHLSSLFILVLDSL